MLKHINQWGQQMARQNEMRGQLARYELYQGAEGAVRYQGERAMREYVEAMRVIVPPVIAAMNEAMRDIAELMAPVLSDFARSVNEVFGNLRIEGD